MRPQTASPGQIIGDNNRERVRQFMLAHVGATYAECGDVLGLSPQAVGRHVKTLKAEWSPGRKRVKNGQRKSK